MWKDRRFTNLVRYCLDEWLPPVVRERAALSWLLARLFHGKGFDIDFKRKAPHMTEEEFAAAYTRVNAGQKARYRMTDVTGAEMDWVAAHAVGPDVLEVGCGHGVLARRLAERPDLRVTATEISEECVESARKYLQQAGTPVRLAVGNLERLPFDDKRFDTTVCAHTLEHVVHFERAVGEMVRVTRRRLLVVVPCQRYYRYTIDYHLHFFPEPAQLVLRMGLPAGRCERVTGDLCYLADLAAAGERLVSGHEPGTR